MTREEAVAHAMAGTAGVTWWIEGDLLVIAAGEYDLEHDDGRVIQFAWRLTPVSLHDEKHFRIQSAMSEEAEDRWVRRSLGAAEEDLS